MKTVMQKWKYIILIIPIITSFFLVNKYGINALVGDEWDILTLYNNISEEGLNIKDFFAQHNEHRILFPRIVLLIIAIFTKWNVVCHMYFSQFLLILSTMIFCKYFNKDMDYYTLDCY